MKTSRLVSLLLCISFTRFSTADSVKDKADQKPVKSDSELIQGLWDGTANEDGNEMQRGPNAGNLLIHENAIVVVKDGHQQKEMGVFRLNSAAMPKQIDSHATEGPDKGVENKGIYELNGDKLRICIRTDDGDRPADFKPGPHRLVLILERKKEVKDLR